MISLGVYVSTIQACDPSEQFMIGNIYIKCNISDSHEILFQLYTYINICMFIYIIQIILCSRLPYNCHTTRMTFYNKNQPFIYFYNNWFLDICIVGEGCNRGLISVLYFWEWFIDNWSIYHKLPSNFKKKVGIWVMLNHQRSSFQSSIFLCFHVQN